MALQDSNIKTDDKRDLGYPLYALDEALVIAKAIYELGGARSPVKKEMLAKHLKFAVTGPSFVQRLGATKSFGLIQGRGEYSLTENAKRYFLPSSQTEKGAMAFLFLKTPKAFEIIVSRFHGAKLPPNEIMGNIMHNEAGVPPSWKDRLASLFVKSAKSISVLDDQGNLKDYDSSGSGAGANEDRKPPPPPLKSEIENELPVPPGTHTYILPLANQRRVTINAPLDITKNEISRLQKWAEVTLLVEWHEKEGEAEVPK